jgi:hypothetical protein
MRVRGAGSGAKASGGCVYARCFLHSAANTILTVVEKRENFTVVT